MNKKAYLLLLLLLALGLVFSLAFYPKEEEEETELLHSNKFFEQKLFRGKKEVRYFSQKTYGGVVPHHLLAFDFIEEIFQRIDPKETRTIILIGPNHFNKGKRVLSSPLSWSTNFGPVVADRQKIFDLEKKGLLELDSEVLEDEHSIGNIMPFIKYYLPEAKVLPLVLKGDLKYEEIKNLARSLSAYVRSEEALIISSVDFSHYLKQAEAEEKDRQMRDFLEQKDFARIYQLSNAYLDSPPSLLSLLLLMDELGLDLEILGNTNSGELLGNPLIETTSYFSLIFQK